MAKCLVILSGGQDSTTCLFFAKRHFEEVHAVTFDYGQRHRDEIVSALHVGQLAGVKSHEVIDIKGLLVSTSPLTSDAPLEQYENAKQMDEVIGDRVELTFVPMRNTLFMTIAMNRAVALGCDSIMTGICQNDNANYPDCTDPYRSTLQLAFNLSLGKEGDFSIIAPLMWMDKAESVKLAHSMPDCWEALAYTLTSYDGKFPPTDMNHANVLRAEGFEKAGLPDPLVLRAWRSGLMELPTTANYASEIAK